MFLGVGPISSSESTDSLEAVESLSKKPKVDPAEEVPKDVVRLFFQRIGSFKDFVAAAGVCKKWRSIAYMPLMMLNCIFDQYPTLAVLQGANFQAENAVYYFFKTLIPALDRMAKLKILGNAGFTIVTLNQATANQLLQQGDFNIVSKRVMSKIGDEPVTGTWVIANSGLEETDNMTYDEQEKHVRAQGCEMVELAPVMALTNQTEDEILFGDDPLVNVRCKNSFESYDGKNAVIFGGDNGNGANIRSYSSDEKVPDYYAGAMIKI